jgi:glycosyltransferase involved in cell wall biosynthesis
MSLNVLVGIPAFDEERTIAKVVLRARRHADRVLVVDDGSHDDTGAIAEGLGANVVRHEKNLGKGAALRDCFTWAKQNGVDVLVTMDADGQHDPSLIPKEKMGEENADVVIGSRRVRPDHHRLSGVSLDGAWKEPVMGQD